jgi:hypothetical protein
MLRGLVARFNRWFAPAAVAASTERSGGSAQGPDAVGVKAVLGEIEDTDQRRQAPADKRDEA